MGLYSLSLAICGANAEFLTLGSRDQFQGQGIKIITGVDTTSARAGHILELDA